jgi:hypothetical protein
MGFLRDGPYPKPPDRHSIVTVTVTEETAWATGFFARVTVVTLMTVFCGRFLVGASTDHQARRQE